MIHLKARKSLGQNYLVDQSANARIVRAIDPHPQDTFIEIGPGTGLLTRHLLLSPLKKLLAFEVDERAVPQLREEFAHEGPRLEVFEADFLEVDLEALAKSIGIPIRIAGNIPYYITSPIIFKLLEHGSLLSDATLLMQQEVAERLVAHPRTKEYGIPTVLASFYAEVSYLFKVPRGAFRPIPNVDSAVVHFDFARSYFTRTHQEPPAGFDRRNFQKFVRGVFGMRRKTLRNNLRAMGLEIQSLESSERGQKFLAQRAEELSLPEMLELHTLLSASK